MLCRTRASFRCRCCRWDFPAEARDVDREHGSEDDKGPVCGTLVGDLRQVL